MSRFNGALAWVLTGVLAMTVGMMITLEITRRHYEVIMERAVSDLVPLTQLKGERWIRFSSALGEVTMHEWRDQCEATSPSGWVLLSVYKSRQRGWGIYERE